MLNTSFKIDTKVVDLFIISLPNSVINSASFFCVSISRFSFVHNVSSFISFKKKGPSHHKELLDRSWRQNLVIISAGFFLSVAIIPQGWFYTFPYFNNSVLHKWFKFLINCLNQWEWNNESPQHINSSIKIFSLNEL